MEAEMIDLAGWERFGEGGNGQSYYHRTDGSVMLKLNDRTWPEEKSLAEFTLSRTVHDLGVKCPEVYRFAARAKEFHSIRCDTAVFESALLQRKSMIDGYTALPDDVRARLEAIYKDFDPHVCTAISIPAI